MNTPLQRLVDRARGGSHSPPLRIEPLLGPVFGAPTEALSGMREIDIEAEAEAPVPAARAPALPGRGNRPMSSEAPVAGRDVDLPAAAPLPSDIAQLTPDVRSAINGERVPADPPRSRVDRAVKPLRTEPLPVADHVSPGRAPDSAAPPSATRLARRQREATAPTAITTEVAPTITISIGQVEVRNAPAPAPAAPRRPTFRPGLSLDAFLRRGQGDG